MPAFVLVLNALIKSMGTLTSVEYNREVTGRYVSRTVLVANVANVVNMVQMGRTKD